MTETRPIAFFDMKAQQALIRADIDRRIAAVLDSGRFINGPEVAALEEKLAAFTGAARPRTKPPRNSCRGSTGARRR